MTKTFHTIGLLAKSDNPSALKTAAHLCDWLINRNQSVWADPEVASACTSDIAQKLQIADRTKIATQIDLAIVVGGDGSLLHAARILVEHDVPVIGVNRGNLGFLTDVTPFDLPAQLEPVLSGRFSEEQRFLIEAKLVRGEQTIETGKALNDIVLSTGDIARMIEFELEIDGDFVYSQRSDGLIVSTPTGSTAYSLSGGGPILHPTLNAIVIVPKFPHTLSGRPIVVDGDRRITLRLSEHTALHPILSCDGQKHIPIEAGDEIRIEKYQQPLRLIHPVDYQYYRTLRSKLGWSSNL